MSYEYKEEILVDIGPEPNCNSESEVENYYSKIRELEKVYEQAAKAAEYEAKAKAFDRIVEQRKKTGVIKLGHHAWEIIREYENGKQTAWEIIKKGDGSNEL